MNINQAEFQVLADGLQTPEAPRWHGDRLWFVDITRHLVAALSPDGTVEVIHRMPDAPGGIGWDADGSLLVVSQVRCKLLREVGGYLYDFCDLLPFFRPDGGPDSLRPNDLVVDQAGRAYVGGMTMTGAGDTPLVLVERDGSARILLDDLLSPNGLAISPDGSTLVVAESMGQRLAAFTIGDGGSLTGRRILAKLDAGPDGICYDADGFIWAACPADGRLVRVSSDGVIDRVLDLPDRMPLACMLGGADGRTLYVATVRGRWSPELDAFVDDLGSIYTGAYEAIRVDVPRAGLP